MYIETERLILRSWSLSDIRSLYNMTSDIELATNCGFKPHTFVEETYQMLSILMINDYTFALELKDNHQVIGNITLIPYNLSLFNLKENEREIGFWLMKDYRHFGYMYEALSKVIDLAFKQYDVSSIICGYFKYNLASERLIKKLGFNYFASQTKYFDFAKKDLELNLYKLENKR